MHPLPVTNRPGTRRRRVSSSHNRNLLALLPLALLAAACRGPAHQPPPPDVPPSLSDEPRWGDERFIGKSLAEIRTILQGALGARVSLSLRSATLQSATRELSDRSRLGIGIAPDAAAAAENHPIDLDLRDLPARHALDWVTRLAGTFYAVETTDTVFITSDRSWASQDRLQMKSYPLGTFSRFPRPMPEKYDPAEEAAKLAALLRETLRHVTAGHANASFVIDPAVSRLTALLPPRGHAKLERILEELKEPREYRPPLPVSDARDEADALAATVLCNFPRQDVRRVADELARRANVNIGFDYRLIDPDRREVALALGETSLARALDALANAAALGKVVPEPGRRFWILARTQDRRVLRQSGELPWDRAAVRSYYIEPLVRQFTADWTFRSIQEELTRTDGDAAPPIVFCNVPDDRLTATRTVYRTARQGEWDPGLPVALYHAPSGRLVVIHDDDGQRAVANIIDQLMKSLRPKTTGKP